MLYMHLSVIILPSMSTYTSTLIALLARGPILPRTFSCRYCANTQIECTCRCSAALNSRALWHALYLPDSTRAGVLGTLKSTVLMTP